ncbi:Uncharacterised protein [Yersinia ruckeri]|nr:Uncharacterised protein [Yersinia ruckeri]
MIDFKIWPAQEHAEYKLGLLSYKDSLNCYFYRGVIMHLYSARYVGTDLRYINENRVTLL